MDDTMEMHAEDLKNLFDHLGVCRVHLVGTSYGSEIAMIFAYTYPDMVDTLHVITGVSELDGLTRAATRDRVGRKHVSPSNRRIHDQFSDETKASDLCR